MNNTLQFNPTSHQLSGPTGSLAISPDDQLARRFIMLVEGQCLDAQVNAIAQKYGCCRQRYYQILAAFKQGGLAALRTRKTGPKSNYRRTDELVRQILRYRFLDPESSPAVITQKLRQKHYPISLRSVERVIADYGVQKKTLHPQPQKPASAAGYSRQSQNQTTRRPRRSAPPGTRGSSTAGG